MVVVDQVVATQLQPRLNSTPLWFPVIMQKSSDTSLSQKKVNKKWFGPTAQVPLISRSFFKSILFFCSLEFKAGKHHLYWMNYHRVINVVTELMTGLREHGKDVSDRDLPVKVSHRLVACDNLQNINNEGQVTSFCMIWLRTNHSAGLM